MSLLHFLSPPKLTVAQIKDFYAYSEGSKWLGQNDQRDQFGSGIALVVLRENKKTAYLGIKLYSAKNWAYVSIENGALRYQYTENGDLRDMSRCPVTDKPAEIHQINKAIWRWYKEKKLPYAIKEIKNQVKEHKAVTVVKEIEISGVDDRNPPVLRVMSDQTSYLIFGTFPPRKTRMTKDQIDHFEQVLAKQLQKKVVHDDRELFIIFDDSPEMIDQLVSFLPAVTR